nr:response regulator transcription factor [Fredinandcohnia onubensis]
MTIKLLVVDDEPIISQGLRFTIPWDSYGVEVIGEASNGKEASEILAHEQVDIVLTDVRMPEMDGIQLARYIHEQMPHIQVIIISGYDDFEYAREAMRFRVQDYLLKPVDIDELIMKVNELKEKIIHQRSQKTKEEKKRLKDAVSQLILTPHLQFPNVNHDLFQGKKYCVLVSEIPDYARFVENQSNEKLAEIRAEWSHNLNNVLKDSISFFAHENLQVSVVFSDVDVQEMTNAELAYTCGMSEKFEDPLKLYEAYQKAIEALFTKESSHEKVLPYKEKTNSSPDIDYSSIYESLFDQDSEELKEHINNLFEKMKQAGYSLLEMCEFCYELNKKIEQKLQGLLSETLLADSTYQVTNEVDLHFYNSSDYLKQLLLSDIQMWHRLLEKENQGKKSWSVEKAIEYIHENFRRDLKASEVANEIHITPNYFSMIFKKELGKSFNDYLNDLRIEKAMQLLTETSDRVYEIATEVGYREYKYFVQVFRKKTGMTPTDYRSYKGIDKN